MSELTWKVGDWAVFERGVVQIKEIRDSGGVSVSNGHVEISGNHLLQRLRPLTLRNKRIAEDFDILYRRLYQIRGESGFNYPDISRHFNALALEAIDADDDDLRRDLRQGHGICAACSRLHTDHSRRAAVPRNPPSRTTLTVGNPHHADR